MHGLVGPLIIHFPDEKKYQQHPATTDRVVMLQDWYYDLSSGLLRESLSPGSASSPRPNTALISGANRVDCSFHPGHRCDNASAVLPTLDLEPGAHHRLRFLTVGGFAWFEITVGHHPVMNMKEVDGTAIEPSPEWDNPALWLFHRRMVWHGEAGMAMQFMARPDVVGGWVIPEENRRLCEPGAVELEKAATVQEYSIWYGDVR